MFTFPGHFTVNAHKVSFETDLFRFLAPTVFLFIGEIYFEMIEKN